MEDNSTSMNNSKALSLSELISLDGLIVSAGAHVGRFWHSSNIAADSITYETIKRAWDEMERRTPVLCGSAEHPHLTSPQGTICHYCLKPLERNRG